jgi:general secretion pathway protein D
MRAKRFGRAIWLTLVSFLPFTTVGGQSVVIDDPVVVRGDSLTVRLVDVDLRSAVQALGRYLDRSVVIGKLPDTRVTLETPQPVSKHDATRLLRGMLESQGIDLVPDSAAGVYRLVERHVTPPTTTPAPTAASQAVDLFVIHLKHAKAADAAATVNSLYGHASALGEIGERPTTLSRQLQQNQIPPMPPAGSPAPPGAVAASARLAGEVTIVPDARANTLLIRASRTDFALIQAAVAEIDVRPAQVLIEVVIAEINRNRQLDLGVSVSVPETGLSGKSTIQGSTTGASTGDFAVTIMHAAGLDAEATLSAAAARGEATILSRPVILAANNEQAEINVGSQRPFVQLSRVLATDNSARDEVVEYKDVGTRLRVTPTISSDDYVMLQVTQEVNAATAEEAFGAPVISTRSVDTKLLVKNTQTIVLGGLRDHEASSSQNGIPFLSSIPILGALFGHVNRTTDETELYIFLTPRILRSDADVDSLTAPLRSKVGPPGHE